MKNINRKTKCLATLLALSLGLAVTACGNSNTSGSKSPSSGSSPAAEKETVIRIGISPAPHEAIVKQVVDILKKEGVKIDIQVFNDYVTPNMALAEGSIDANFFQHTPYFEQFCKEHKLNLEVLGGVHIEPMGIFSKKYKKLDEVKDGDKVQIPNDPTNGGRALLLLQSKGLIKLKDGGSVTSTEKDVVENPKHLQFVPLEAALIPSAYQDAGVAVINGNYAIQNGLNPVRDSLAIEGADSPYVNIVAVRKGDAQKPQFQKLIKALQSDAIKSFIEKNYDGSVVPAFTKP